jgi:hypothetical protein
MGDHLRGWPRKWFPVQAGDRGPRPRGRNESAYFFFRMGMPVLAVSWTI